MNDTDFDHKLVTAAFALAADIGWSRVSVAQAARDAGLKLDEVRARFPGRNAVLMTFGRLADQVALAAVPTEGSTRDRLFDLFMQRLEFLQAHRDGVLALLRVLPTDPALALLLSSTSRRSVAWMLEAAGVDTSGLEGSLRVSGALAIWLWTVRAWQGDGSEDLAATMSALDQALTRAEQAAGWLRRGAPSTGEPEVPLQGAAGGDEMLPVTLPESPPEASDSPPPSL